MLTSPRFARPMLHDHLIDGAAAIGLPDTMPPLSQVDYIRRALDDVERQLLEQAWATLEGGGAR